MADWNSHSYYLADLAFRWTSLSSIELYFAGTSKRAADRDRGQLGTMARCEGSQPSPSFRWRLHPAQEQRPLLST